MKKDMYTVLLESLLENLLKQIDEGVIGMDASSVALFYNQKMAVLEDIKIEDALGKPFKEIYPYLPEDVSTLMKALRRGEATINKQQTYLNTYANEVTTINTTVPLMHEGNVIGALEVAKDVTKLKEMSNAITHYQREKASNKAKAKVGKIKYYTLDDIVGQDPEILHLKNRVMTIADHPFPVLICGETGTGKELFAQSIHYAGKRAKNPLLAQNCAAMPSTLLESILFGTVKGGFTGAEDVAGLFEQASGGTLLLDEINAMPYDLQSKLLRVLQEGYVRRIGGTKDIPVDVRVIAITNEPMDNLIEKRLFRKDLFYRLNTVSLTIPPLRERMRDIPLLVDYFIEKHSPMLKRTVLDFSEEALRKLMSYDYQGNIRELENLIIAAMTTMHTDGIIREGDIVFQEVNHTTRKPLKSISPHYEKMGAGFLDGQPLPQKMKEVEREIIQTVMEENGGNITKSARQLGINRQNLQYKLRNL